MRPIGAAAPDRRVGEEPGIAPAPQIRAPGPPAGEVALVLVGNPYGEPIELDLAPVREVKDVLLGAVKEATRGDRLVMSHGEIARERGPRARERSLDGDRLYPMNDVLQDELLTALARDVERKPRVCRWTAHIEEERPPRSEYPADTRRDGADPVEVLRSGFPVVVLAVRLTEVVGRRGNDDIDAPRRESQRETRKTVLAPERDGGAPRARQGRERAGLRGCCNAPPPGVFPLATFTRTES